MQSVARRSPGWGNFSIILNDQDGDAMRPAVNFRFRHLIGCIIAFGVMLGFVAVTGSADAHGDKPHSKCKRGYTLDDEHKCVPKK